MGKRIARDGGIEEERSCRDLLFLLVFAAFWVGMFIVAGRAGQEGDYRRLMYPLDGYGDLCASHGRGHRVHWLEPQEFVRKGPTGAADHRVCVASCPGADDAVLATLAELDFDASTFSAEELDQRFVCYYKYQFCAQEGYCAGELPEEEKYATQYASQVMAKVGIEGFTGSDEQKWCYPILVPTYSVLNRCWPDLSVNTTEGVTNTLDALGAPDWAYGAFDQVADGFSDLYKAYAVWVVCGLAIPLVASFLWLVAMRYLSGVMAWLTVLLVNLCFIAITIWCFVKAGIIGEDAVASIGYDLPDVYDSPDEKNKELFTHLAWVSCVVTALFLIFTLVMISRIRIAIATVKVAASAVGTMPLLMFFPLVPFVLTVVLIVYFALVAALIYTAGEITHNCPLEADRADTPVQACLGYSTSWDENLRYSFLYHLFGLLWTYQFISGVTILTIAGSVASYYWARGDSAAMPGSPVSASLRRTCRYHLGSVALGSFIVAVIQMVRLFLEYLDKKTKEAQEANQALKFLMCCAKYCLWYLEKIMQFINRNAYIMVAVKGKGYCASASHAIGLIARNALRVLAINTVGDAIPFLGKMVVTAGAGVLAFYACDMPAYTEGENQISSPLFPVIFTVLFAWFVADCFFAVYEVAVDTILLSFCEDCDVNDGEPQYAPSLLLDAIGQAPPPSAGRGKSTEMTQNPMPMQA